MLQVSRRTESSQLAAAGAMHNGARTLENGGVLRKQAVCCHGEAEESKRGRSGGMRCSSTPRLPASTTLLCVLRRRCRGCLRIKVPTHTASRLVVASSAVLGVDGQVRPCSWPASTNRSHACATRGARSVQQLMQDGMARQPSVVGCGLLIAAVSPWHADAGGRSGPGSLRHVLVRQTLRWPTVAKDTLARTAA